MPATFFIGDLHLRHGLVSDTRGFSNTDAHDNSIIRQWLKQVKPDDTVKVMGDISAGGREAEERALQILTTLPGRKHLIAGNHDTVSGMRKQPSPNRMLFNEVFEKISDFGSMMLNKKRILLSHLPYEASGDGPVRGPGRYNQFRLPDRGDYLIHAHTHFTHPTSGSATGREICVSWDAWRRLADMGDIARLIKQMKEAS